VVFIWLLTIPKISYWRMDGERQLRQEGIERVVEGLEAFLFLRWDMISWVERRDGE
jgi:hypothetical protein